jgi:hypothetical protein
VVAVTDSPPLEDLSRDELIGRVRDLEERVDRLEQKEYLKALIRQVLAEDQPDLETLDAALLHIQQVTRFPEDVAREELSPNEYRARWVWMNLADISHRVDNGRVVKAGELRRLLQTRDGEDETIYTSTVGRVMEAVVRLTDDIATVTKSKDGERRLFVPNDWRRQAESREDGNDP